MNLLILLFFPLLPSLISALPSPTLPQRDNDVNHPTPIRPFTVAAFQSPCPVISNASFCSAGITGLTLRAQGGSFWLTNEPQRPNTACSLTSSGSTAETKNCPPGNQTVLWVDKDGQAWLDSTNPQQIYMDTQTGILSYLTSVSLPTPNTFTPGALVTNFLHLGQGTSITTPIPGQTQFFNVGPSTFVWFGTPFNSYWFACARPGPGYQVMMDVGGLNDFSICESGIQLVALDYSGPSPAAGVYL